MLKLKMFPMCFSTPHGLAIPSDLVLDAYADAIARNREKFPVVYSVRVLAEMGRDFRKLFSHLGP